MIKCNMLMATTCFALNAGRCRFQVPLVTSNAPITNAVIPDLLTSK